MFIIGNSGVSWRYKGVPPKGSLGHGLLRATWAVHREKNRGPAPTHYSLSKSTSGQERQRQQALGRGRAGTIITEKEKQGANVLGRTS